MNRVEKATSIHCISNLKLVPFIPLYAMLIQRAPWLSIDFSLTDGLRKTVQWN